MKRPVRIAAICLTIGGGAVTLLLWAKLKLVAGIPRTVYAEPQVTDNQAPPQVEGTRYGAPGDHKPAESPSEDETPGRSTK